MISATIDCRKRLGLLRFTAGLVGVVPAAFFIVWLLAGWLGWVPSMVDLFGIPGMRMPASITVAGLLLAAAAFWEC